MYKKVSDLSEIKFILDNIRNEDKEELIAVYGNNWYKKALDSLTDKDFLVLYGIDSKNNTVPIAMGGFYEVNNQECSVAAVWLLSSYFIELNKTLFVKEVFPLVIAAKRKYEIIYNYIYKSNNSSKNWLKSLGFIFDNSASIKLNVKPGFELFYMINGKE